MLVDNPRTIFTHDGGYPLVAGVLSVVRCR